MLLQGKYYQVQLNGHPTRTGASGTSLMGKGSLRLQMLLLARRSGSRVLCLLPTQRHDGGSCLAGILQRHVSRAGCLHAHRTGNSVAGKHAFSSPATPMLTLLKRQNPWGGFFCQSSLCGNGLSIRVLLLSFVVWPRTNVPPSGSEDTALPPWLITIALAAAVVIIFADVRDAVNKSCGECLAVQPTTTPWAMTPITAEWSAVPHAKSPLFIEGRRNRQQGGRHRVRLTWYALRVRRVCAVRAVAAWT